jgi:ferredoxin-NADP reductase/ferredoxin
MPSIRYDDNDYPLLEKETVLDCLARHEVDVPSSCRSGICQTCMMQAVKGRPPASAQKDLKPTLVEQNYFLACICQPEEDLEIRLANDMAAPQVSARIEQKDSLAPGITRLVLQPEQPFEYRPGQFIHIYHPDGLIRSYSLSSVPALDTALEIHVKRIPDGRVSGWLCDTVAPGDTLQIAGPFGNCFYLPSPEPRNLLLIGTGTGLAPLRGIIRDALDQNHDGEIHLFHGGLTEEGLYMGDELNELARQHPQFDYTPCVLHRSAGSTVEQGRVDDIAFAAWPKLTQWQVYLCGDPDLVNKAKRQAFLSGASLQDIHADPFIVAEAQ